MGTYSYSTGNEIVDRVGRMNFSGNIVDESWFHTIIDDKGNSNLLSISLLSEIVYWYRPMEMRDEATGNVFFRKKFNADDFLQLSYERICKKFNCSKKQAREALRLLEQHGVIKKHLRIVVINDLKMNNVMFIELLPSGLEKVTRSDDDEGSCPPGHHILTSSDDEGGSCPAGHHPMTDTERPQILQGKTNTKTTQRITKNTNKTTTEAGKEVSVDVKNNPYFIFLPPDVNLSDDDKRALLREAGDEPDRIMDAISALKEQTTPIRNPVGWLIMAIRKKLSVSLDSPLGFNFRDKPALPDTRNQFNRYRQHDYDFDTIYRCCVANL